MQLKKILQRVRRRCIRSAVQSMARPFPVTAAPSVVIAPHPDDEVLGCAGLMRAKRALGAQVSVVFVTDGAAAHEHCCPTAPRTIGTARRRLATEACRLLGLSPHELHWLGLEDGAVPGGGMGYHAAVTDLAALLGRLGPAEIFVPHPLEPWPDHRAATAIATGALASYRSAHTLWYYPVWSWYGLPLRSLPQLVAIPPFRLALAGEAGVKRDAIHTYLSSLNPACGNPFCGLLPDGFVELFRGDEEIFFKG